MNDETLRQARALITDHLAGRSLPAEALGPIEQAVAEQLRDGADREMDDALKRLIDAYADMSTLLGGAPPDDDPPTTTDVHWTAIGPR